MLRIDISAKDLCEANGGTYDAAAVELVVALERAVRRADRHGHFGVVLNAIEYMVEDGSGHPRVLSHLADAVIALAEVHQLPPRSTKKVTSLLHQLRECVAVNPGR